MDANANNGDPGKNWAVSFFTIWTGQAFSLLGSQLVQFALIWWLTRETGSANVLAMATLVGMLPMVVLGPLVGALVDRWNRRLILIVADSTIALATLVLAGLFYSGQVQIWHVYAVIFVRALGGGFHMPTMQASTSLMVPKRHLARVQGMNQTLYGGMNILSAPLGALLLELVPVQGVLAIDVTTALLAISPLFFIAIPQPVRTLTNGDGRGLKSVWLDMLAGFRYAWGWTGLVLVGVMASLINMLLTPAGSLTPILVTKHFQGDAFHLAWIQSAEGVGVVVGGVLLSVWGGFKRQIVTSLVGVFGIGVGILAVGLTTGTMFWAAVFFMFLVGMALPVANGPLMAVVQAAVDPEMQGRVFTLIGSLSMGSSPLGLVLAGPIAEAFGVQVFYVAGGVTAILLAVGMFFIPAVMRIEQGRPDDLPAPEAADSQAASYD